MGWRVSAGAGSWICLAWISHHALRLGSLLFAADAQAQAPPASSHVGKLLLLLAYLPRCIPEHAGVPRVVRPLDAAGSVHLSTHRALAGSLAVGGMDSLHKWHTPMPTLPGLHPVAPLWHQHTHYPRTRSTDSCPKSWHPGAPLPREEVCPEL